MIGRYTFYDGVLVDVQYLPVHIEGWGQPRLADSTESQLLLDAMRTASESLAPY